MTAASAPALSVVIAAHSPDPLRFARVLTALRDARRAAEPRTIELIVVRNAGEEITPAVLELGGTCRLIEEDRLGIAYARSSGIQAARSERILFIDDDTVTAPDYLVNGLAFAAAHPEAGVFGGRIRGEFAHEPPTWTRPLHGYLALRDLGTQSRVVRFDEDLHFDVPGAGMFLVRSVAEAFSAMVEDGRLDGIGRSGSELASGDDTACCLIARRQGLALAYCGTLDLVHIIPAARLSPDYFARIVFNIGRSAAKLDAIFNGADTLVVRSAWQIAARRAIHMLRHGLRAGRISVRWHEGYRVQAIAERRTRSPATAD